MMNWLCSDCGRDIYEHTVRDAQTGKCTYTPPPAPKKEFTATELGLVNPEALEDTGENWDHLRRWRSDFYVNGLELLKNKLAADEVRSRG